MAGSPAQRAGLWTLREGVSEAQNAAGPSLKHDVTVPIGALPGFVERTAALLERALPGVRLVTYGHVGDGNLHHNLTAPVGADPAAFEARAGELSRIVYDEVAAASGSISAEHGLGTAKPGRRRVVQGPRRAGPDAHRQGRPGPARADEPRQGPGRAAASLTGPAHGVSVSPSSPRSTCTVPPSTTSPAISSRASGSPIAVWISRRSGRAPYAGS